MATSSDPNRPSTGPLSTAQRQRLEAAQFAKRLIGKGGSYHNPEVDTEEMLRVADWIVTGAL